MMFGLYKHHIIKMEKKSGKLVHVGICLGLLFVILSMYFFASEKISKKIEIVLKDDFKWVVQVDSVRTEANQFVLEGFAFRLNQNATEEAFEIVLHNLDTGEYFFPKMEYKDREDVNDYFFCEYDYTKSGFVARIKEEKLNLGMNDFEILLRPNAEKNPYQFATYLSEGELMYVNPKEYVPLEVEGTSLEEIVEKGVVRVYRPDVGIYVFQYDGRLYWLADTNFVFEEDGITCIQYQIGTTQVNKLPLECQQKRWNFERREYNFEVQEAISLQTGKYRVVERTLPTEYSVLDVVTGYYLDDWIWYQMFRPYIVFEGI